MTIVHSMAGWIVFAIVSSFTGDKWAALAALVVCAISVLIGLQETRSAATVVIEIATALYFAVVTVLLFSTSNLRPNLWVSAASQFWLACAVGLTLAIGRPFTLAIAKREAPPEVWDTPQFYDFNVMITRAWMISFLVSAILLAVLSGAGLTTAATKIPVIVLATLVPLAYTRRQVARMQAPPTP